MNNPTHAHAGASLHPEAAPVSIHDFTLQGPSIRLQFLARSVPADVAHELLTTPVLRRMSPTTARLLAESACRGKVARYGRWTLERGEE